MREILFKAKRVDNGEWVEGLLWKKKYNDGNRIFISCFPDKDDNEKVYVVRHETVGQFTGLTDKNGKKIFEGDIVHCWGGEYAFGFWEHNNTFAFTDISDYMQMAELGESEFLEVIGNIYGNPESLTAERKE